MFWLCNIAHVCLFFKKFWATKHSRVPWKHVVTWDRAQATSQRLSYQLQHIYRYKLSKIYWNYQNNNQWSSLHSPRSNSWCLPEFVKKSRNSEIKQLCRDLRIITSGEELNFLFLLDQTLKNLNRQNNLTSTIWRRKDSSDYYAFCRKVRIHKKTNSEKSVKWLD